MNCYIGMNNYGKTIFSMSFRHWMCPGNMKKILSEMEVTKVGMNHERDHIRVYLLGQSSYT